MILYEVWYSSRDGCFRSWHSTKQQALTRRQELIEEQVCDPEFIDITRHDLSTRKADILRMLNHYADADNG